MSLAIQSRIRTFILGCCRFDGGLVLAYRLEIARQPKETGHRVAVVDLDENFVPQGTPLIIEPAMVSRHQASSVVAAGVDIDIMSGPKIKASLRPRVCKQAWSSGPGLGHPPITSTDRRVRLLARDRPTKRHGLRVCIQSAAVGGC